MVAVLDKHLYSELWKISTFKTLLFHTILCISIMCSGKKLQTLNTVLQAEVAGVENDKVVPTNHIQGF